MWVSYVVCHAWLSSGRVGSMIDRNRFLDATRCAWKYHHTVAEQISRGLRPSLPAFLDAWHGGAQSGSSRCGDQVGFQILAPT